MRILLATYEYPPDLGGIAAYLGGLFGAVRAKDFRVLRLTRPAKPGGWLAHLPALWWAAWRAKADLVVVSHVLPVGTAARLIGKPYVVIVHGLDLRSAAAHPRKRRIAARVLKDAKLVVANSAATAVELAAFGMDASRALVLTPCPGDWMRAHARKFDEASRPDIRARLGLEGKKVLLSVGRLMPRKGFDRLIRLLPELRKSCGDVMLVIAGAGPEERTLRQDAQRSGIDTHIRFLVAPDGDALAAAYRAADVFALAVRGSKEDVEGFGIVFLEAALFGLASVSSRVGGVPEAVVDGVTGLLVDADSDGELFAALKRLLDDPAEAKRLGEAGRVRAERDFAWEPRAQTFISRLA